MLILPDAPMSIKKGFPLKNILGESAVECLANNIAYVYPAFDKDGFKESVMDGLEKFEFMDRGIHIARTMHQYLPEKYEDAVKILLNSLTPPNTRTEGLGLAVFFYHPHGCYISEFGLDKKYNGGNDPFDVSMNAQYELTKRNTSEFSIRPYLIEQQQRTLSILKEWVTDPDPHVRRLCSEGTRPRLPWARRIPGFVENPQPILPILEALKNDSELYVRRSVANSFGDIAKDHPELVYSVFTKWLDTADKNVKWIIRHALRLPAKKGDKVALEIRASAK